MKKSLILLITLFLSNTYYIFSQRGMAEFMSEYYKDKLHRTLVSDYGGAEGSAYLYDDFKKGIAYMKSKKQYEMSLRFNLYENKFEFNVDSAIYFIHNPLELIKIEMNGETYVYFKLNKRYRYVELIESGKTTLIGQKGIVLVAGEKPEAYVDPKPPYFRRKKDAYYIIDKENNARLIKNKKSLADIFSDKKKEITEYMKKEKIKANKKEHLKRLVKYYNDL